MDADIFHLLTAMTFVCMISICHQKDNMLYASKGQDIIACYIMLKLAKINIFSQSKTQQVLQARTTREALLPYRGCGKRVYGKFYLLLGLPLHIQDWTDLVTE